MCSRGKFRRSLYNVCPLCEEEGNTREHAINDWRKLKKVRENLRRNLKREYQSEQRKNKLRFNKALHF